MVHIWIFKKYLLKDIERKGLTPKNKENQSKNKQVGVHQTKKLFCTARETVIKMEDNLLKRRTYLQITYLIKALKTHVTQKQTKIH